MPDRDDFDEFVPDPDADLPGGPDDREPEVGRLVEPDSEVDMIDKTAESVAQDVGADDGDLSAEEAAMHITDSP